MAEPSQLFRWKSDHEPVQDVGAQKESTLLGGDWRSESKTCVHDAIHTDHGVHQSTPMLSLSLCNRADDCKPTKHNTILLGMVQRRLDPPGYPYTFYHHHLVAYESVAPYKMVSVSKKLTYHGVEDGKYTWTGNMVYYFNHTAKPHDRSHGFLDDDIWLGFGIGDKAPGWLDVTARDLVMDLYLCREASTQLRMNMRRNRLLG